MLNLVQKHRVQDPQVQTTITRAGDTTNKHLIKLLNKKPRTKSLVRGFNLPIVKIKPPEIILGGLIFDFFESFWIFTVSDYFSIG